MAKMTDKLTAEHAETVISTRIKEMHEILDEVGNSTSSNSLLENLENIKRIALGHAQNNPNLIARINAIAAEIHKKIDQKVEANIQAANVHRPVTAVEFPNVSYIFQGFELWKQENQGFVDAAVRFIAAHKAGAPLPSLVTKADLPDYRKINKHTVEDLEQHITEVAKRSKERVITNTREQEELARRVNELLNLHSISIIAATINTNLRYTVEQRDKLYAIELSQKFVPSRHSYESFMQAPGCESWSITILNNRLARNSNSQSMICGG